MTDDQIAEAERLALEWLEAHGMLTQLKATVRPLLAIPSHQQCLQNTTGLPWKPDIDRSGITFAQISCW